MYYGTTKFTTTANQRSGELRFMANIEHVEDDLSDLEMPGPKVMEWATEPVAVPPFVQPDYYLALPEAALYGKLGELTKTLDSPFSWSWPTMVTAFATLGIHTMGSYSQAIRPNLYTVLMGKVASGKSTVMRRSLRSLDIPEKAIKKAHVGSDRGLEQVLRVPKPEGWKKGDPEDRFVHTSTLWMDEMSGVMTKLAYEGSTLAQNLCDLHGEDEVSFPTRDGLNTITAKLNLLGAVPCSDGLSFSSVFTSATTGGLWSRMILAPGPTDWTPDHTWLPKRQRLTPSVIDIPVEAITTAAAWAADTKAQITAAAEKAKKPVPNLSHIDRISESALRCALIQSSANHDDTITEASLRAALVMADWQVKVKSIYKASAATTPEAVAGNMILDALANAPAGKFTNFPTLLKREGWRDTLGSAIFNKMKRVMIDNEEIRIAMTKGDDGEIEKHWNQVQLVD